MPWYNFILSQRAHNFILVVIIINAITLGLETSSGIVAATGSLLPVLDKIALGIFIAEMILKIMALGRKYPKDPWNVFDFIIVSISVVLASGSLTVLRSLRILRMLRLISSLPKLRMLVRSLLVSLPSIGWIALLMSLVFYVFAVMATKLFGPTFPEWFGSLGATLFTLFQIMTLESWAMGIVRPVMEAFPYAYIFFVPFVLLSSFVVLNLFIAIMVTSIGECHLELNTPEKKAGSEADSADLEQELKILRQQIDRVENLVRLKVKPNENTTPK